MRKKQLPSHRFYSAKPNGQLFVCPLKNECFVLNFNAENSICDAKMYFPFELNHTQHDVENIIQMLLSKLWVDTNESILFYY